MRIDHARTLHNLVDARYRARQQIFQTLLQREAAVRADLAKLDTLAKSSEPTVDRAMTSIGADVRWKAWLGRSKKSLNMKLALILAEKDQHLRQVKRAYGKVLASEAILRDLSDKRLSDARQKDLEAAITMSQMINERSRCR